MKAGTTSADKAKKDRTVNGMREEMLYLQKKAAFESADLALLQALESYQWAARGL